MSLTVAEYLLKALKQQQIDTLFLVPGGMIDPFLRSYHTAGIRAIVTAHEAGAAYMADGYGRARRQFGVCMGIGGPGITNMITAVAAAQSDHAPILIIGGSIPREWEGLEAVQDSSPSGISDVTLLQPITGWSQQLPLAEATPRFLRQALRSMFGYPRAPAFLSIPLTLQQQRLTAPPYQPLPLGVPVRLCDRQQLQPLQSLLRAPRLLLWVGNGLLLSESSEQLQQFAERWQLPVVTTLRAKGALDERHPIAFGVFGIGGSLQASQLLLGSSDATIATAQVVIALGVSMNEQNALAAGAFDSAVTLIDVDIDPARFEDSRYQVLPIQADCGAFLLAIAADQQLSAALQQGVAERQQWLAAVRQTPYYAAASDRHSDQQPLHPARVLTELRRYAPDDARLIADSGAHTFFCAHYWQAYGPNQCFVWTNNGPMGYAVAAAIGMRLACPEQPIIAVIGDGGMLMHGIELQTAVRYQVPIVVVVINNAALGNVYLRALSEQQQEAMALTRSPTHDWVAFAESLGAAGRRVTTPAQLAAALTWAFAAAAPILLDIHCGADYPTPNPGAAALL